MPRRIRRPCSPISAPDLRATGAAVLAVAAVLAALFVMAHDVPAPLHGHHVFRQAHVAANIDKMLADGPSLHPRTYNADVVGVFDFPLYQLGVAALAKATGAAPLATARAVSLLVFAATLVVLASLLRATGVTRVTRHVALALFAAAPLVLFYGVAPIEDGLALLMSYVSLRAFASWARRPSAGAWTVMAGAGMLAALIKPPIYLDGFVAVVWCWSFGRRRGPRWMAGYAALVALAVAVFLAYSLTADRSAQELVQGSALDRLRPALWAEIGGTTLTLVLNPVTAALAAYGAAVELRRRTRRGSLYAGLLVGSALTVLAFFSRFQWHDYYQLPLVFPLAYFAAAGVHHLLLRRRQRPLAHVVVLTMLTVACLAWTRRGYAELARSAWALEQSAAGEWLQAQTASGDFILYLVDGPERDYSPAFLYFARRDGYNLWRPEELTRAKLDEIRGAYGPRYRRLLLFCPRGLARAAGPRLRSLGAPIVGEGDAGRLFDVSDTATTIPRDTPA
jgi:hypothetical protein